MDLKVFSRFIMGLGFVVALLGGVAFLYGGGLVADAKEARRNIAYEALADSNVRGGLNSSEMQSKLDHIADRKKDGEMYIEKGTYVGIAGSIVLFLGFGLFSAASPSKRKKSDMESATSI